MNNQGVEVKNGEAFFNGQGRLLIPRFTNVDFGKTFVIRLRYRELEKLKFNESQALVNNGDCGDFGSIQIFTKRNSIGYVVKTTKEPSHVSLQLHKPVSRRKGPGNSSMPPVLRSLLFNSLVFFLAHGMERCRVRGL